MLPDMSIYCTLSQPCSAFFAMHACHVIFHGAHLPDLPCLDTPGCAGCVCYHILLVKYHHYIHNEVLIFS